MLDIVGLSVIGKFNEAIMTQSEKLPHTKFNKKLKPYWSAELTSLSKANKAARRDGLMRVNLTIHCIQSESDTRKLKINLEMSRG